MKHWPSILILTLLCVAMPATATAAECVGVSFPDHVEIDGQRLTLNGLGLREATVFEVDVYVAALYLPKRSSDAAAIIGSDGPKRLVMRFVRDVEESKVRDAVQKRIETSSASPSEELRRAARTAGSWMGAVEEGDTYTFTHLPGQGVTIAFNDRVKGTIASSAFARVLFDIWLGEDPPNAGLKTGLLGGACG